MIPACYCTSQSVDRIRFYLAVLFVAVNWSRFPDTDSHNIIFKSRTKVIDTVSTIMPCTAQFSKEQRIVNSFSNKLSPAYLVFLISTVTCWSTATPRIKYYVPTNWIFLVLSWWIGSNAQTVLQLNVVMEGRRQHICLPCHARREQRTPWRHFLVKIFGWTTHPNSDRPQKHYKSYDRGIHMLH
jgi:hypothetical protein